jgi:guanine deaminase
MNGTTTPKRTLYVGPFVHSKSLQDLEICQEGIIGVDEHGKIAFIERAGIDAAAAEKHGWSSYEVVRIRDNGFFFPGFIGMSLMSIFYSSFLKV